MLASPVNFDLFAVDGFTEGKLQRFGAKLLDVIKNHVPTAHGNSLRRVLLKHPIKGDELQISGYELKSLFDRGLTVSEVADVK